MSEIKTYRKHVFVCCTEGCCGARGGEAVYQTLRTEFSERKITDVLVTRTQCLGLCPEAGATVAVYPDGLWYVVSRAEEGTEIAHQHLIAGRPVQRLLSQEISLEAQRKEALYEEQQCQAVAGGHRDRGARGWWSVLDRFVGSTGADGYAACDSAN